MSSSSASLVAYRLVFHYCLLVTYYFRFTCLLARGSSLNVAYFMKNVLCTQIFQLSSILPTNRKYFTTRSGHLNMQYKRQNDLTWLRSSVHVYII